MVRWFLQISILSHLALGATGAEAKKGSGYEIIHDVVAEVPWSVQILKIDRTNRELQLHTGLAKGNAIGLVPLPKQIGFLPEDLGRPIAAINGDYYLDREPYIGDPKGVQIMRGELVSAPCGWTCLWVNDRGEPQMEQVESKFAVTWANGDVTPIGLNEPRSSGKCVLYTRAVGSTTRTRGGVELVLERASTTKWLPLEIGEEYSVVVSEVRNGGNSQTSSNSMILSIGPKAFRKMPKFEKGMALRISTATTPSLKGAPTAISGGPALIRDGTVQVGWSAIRHPRSAVGWNKDFIYMVQVDGRQSGHSVGMTYSELASYMAKLGCEQALNLDGGGSATFWGLGQVINSPSEGEARGIANSLVLVHRGATNAVTAEVESDN